MNWLLRKDRFIVAQGGGKETVRKGRSSELRVPLRHRALRFANPARPRFLFDAFLGPSARN